MYRWFTHYDGPWNLARVTSSLSENFKNEIASLVKQLDLIPVQGSPKKGAGVIKYGDDIRVVVSKFTFSDFAPIDGEDHRYYTPVFKFDLVVMAKKLGRVRSGESDFDVVYKGPMIVTFNEDYPHDYPNFVLPKYKYFRGASHSHHMYSGGRMCIYGDFGHSDRAWDSSRDTSAAAFGPAMRWIVWHERDREEGVDADDVNA